MNYPTGIFLALSTFGLNAAERVDSVPARFLGEWSAGARACGAEWDDSMLVIKATHITYWGSAGLIKAVVTKGTGEIMLIAELSGEGETRLGNSHFKLSADGSSLTAVGHIDKPFVRYPGARIHLDFSLDTGRASF